MSAGRAAAAIPLRLGGPWWAQRRNTPTTPTTPLPLQGDKEAPKALDEYCKDLCEEVRQGKIDPVSGNVKPRGGRARGEGCLLVCVWGIGKGVSPLSVRGCQQPRSRPWRQAFQLRRGWRRARGGGTADVARMCQTPHCSRACLSSPTPHARAPPPPPPHTPGPR